MSPKKLTLIASLGAGLEYYDFIIYGLLASYLSKAFFPAINSLTAILQTFAIFAIGYVVRPLGAIILGSIGDHYGRRKIFLLTLFLMAFATMILGVLPTYAQCGLWAPCLLIIVRILQGLTFSTEIPGLVTYLLEHISKKSRYFYVGLSLSSLSFGSALGSAIVFGLNKILTVQQMSEFGWRIPFIFGGVLAIVSYFIRKKLQETPAFLAYLQTERQQHPIRELWQRYRARIGLAFGMSFFSACFVMYGVALPAFLHEFYGYSLEQVYLWNSIGLVWSMMMLPVFGWVASYIGRIQLLMITTGIFIVSSVGLFHLLNIPVWGLAAFVLIYNTIMAALANGYLPILSQLFPTSVRLTGAAFSYNLLYSFAGFTPWVLSKFIAMTHGTQYYFFCFVVLAVIGLLSAIAVNRKIMLEL